MIENRREGAPPTRATAPSVGEMWEARPRGDSLVNRILSIFNMGKLNKLSRFNRYC